MSSTNEADALRRGLRARVITAGCLLIVGLVAFVWLAQETPPSLPPQPKVQAAAPHAGSITLTVKPADAGPTVNNDPVPLAQTGPGAPPSSDAAASDVKPQPATTAVAGEIVQTVDTSPPAADTDATAKRAAAAPKEKLPRGPHLQAGVFVQAVNAQELKAKLEAEGLPVYIESRVQIGPFKNRKEAEAMREKLKADGVATVLIAQ